VVAEQDNLLRVIGKKEDILCRLLVAKKLHGRIWNDPCTIGAIALEKSTEALSSPDILETLNCTVVLNAVWILNLSKPCKLSERSTPHNLEPPPLPNTHATIWEALPIVEVGLSNR